jgi:hypothetical protein
MVTARFFAVISKSGQNGQSFGINTGNVTGIDIIARKLRNVNTFGFF